MNPQVRYPDQAYNPNGIKFSYDEMRTIDRMNSQLRPNDSSKFSSQIPKPQIASSQPILMKHKSNNIDNHFYQEANFTQSYRIQSNPFSAFANQDNTSYKSHKSTNQDNIMISKSTNYVNHREEVNKFETANDFFTVAAESIRNEDKFRHQLRNTQHIPKQTQHIPQSYPPFEPPTKNQKNQQVNDQKYEPTSDECEKCEQMKKQNERIIAFMRQQLEIGAKQFTYRMNKIIVQQAKQIKDLRKSLINNEKLLINFNKQRDNPQNWKGERSISPGRGVLKQKSPSKLSLTKSNTSVSTNNASRQKITMVSKQLSPSKTSLNNNNTKRQQKQQTLSHQKLSSTIHAPNQHALTSQEIQRKIKTLEEYIQALCKMEHQRNQKTLLMNKKIQMLQKGVISYFGSRTQHLKNFLNQWVNTQQERLKQLYQQMKVISSRVGSMANNQSNPPLKQINSTNLKNTQNSCHSTPSILINPNYKDGSSQFNLNRVSMKLKNFSSEIDDLKSIATNLQTKEFKYDNFQIETLRKLISEVNTEVKKLDKARQQISDKLIENQEKLQKVIEMSKYSHMGSHTEIYPSSGSENQISNNNNNMKKISKANIMRNNSVEISYSNNNNYMNQTGYRANNNDGTKSMKSQIPGKFDKSTSEQSILPKFMNIINNKKYTEFEGYSHSQFNGFAGEESGFSQYAEESVYNNEEMGERDKRYKQENYEKEEESFERSQADEQDQQQQEQEEDDFFYRVDLSTHDKMSQNGMNYQMSSHHTSNQRNQNQRIRMGHNNYVPSSTINRFMEVIQYRQNKPLRIQIDETGYIKSADNGMYIVDRNMDGFDLSRHQLQWLKQNGIVILEK